MNGKGEASEYKGCFFGFNVYFPMAKPKAAVEVLHVHEAQTAEARAAAHPAQNLAPSRGPCLGLFLAPDQSVAVQKMEI